MIASWNILVTKKCQASNCSRKGSMLRDVFLSTQSELDTDLDAFCSGSCLLLEIWNCAGELLCRQTPGILRTRKQDKHGDWQAGGKPAGDGKATPWEQPPVLFQTRKSTRQ